MIIDMNIHHLPEDLFTNEKILDDFLVPLPDDLEKSRP